MSPKQSKGAKNFVTGLVIYTVCIVVAALPVFSSPLRANEILELCAAAAAASMLVAAIRYSRAHKFIRDHGGMFVQALLGIAICSGLYSFLAVNPRPEVMFLAFLLWSAVGLMHLTPYRVGLLFALSAAIFLNAFSPVLLAAPGGDLAAEVTLMLLFSAVMAGFMYWRARSYTLVREEKQRLREENKSQAGRLKEVQMRIETLTVQDMDTIALKYPYFKNALKGEKLRADQDRTTFSIGLVEIDHFAEIRERCGELVAKQLLRAFADRATALIKKMDFVSADDDRYHPLGRVGDGLFGLVLPGANLKGAKYCVERLHSAVEFQDIPTEIGPMSVTLSIGVTEYRHGEDVDAMMAELARSMVKARLEHERQQLEAANRPQQPMAPLKGARSMSEMALLDHNDYGRPVH